MKLYKRIDEILWTDWDPVGVSGVPEARDEYYGYLPTVFQLVLENASENKITEYLLWVETKRMGLSGNQQKCKQIAAMVLKERNELGL